MDISNSVEQTQKNNLTSSVKTKNESNEQSQLAAAAGFADQLTKATSAINPAKDTVNAIKDKIAPAMDVAFNFNKDAISASGLNANDFLTKNLRSGIQAQLGSLATGIATNLIAGLAGQDSATAKSEAPKESAEPVAQAAAATPAKAPADSKADPSKVTPASADLAKTDAVKSDETKTDTDDASKIAAENADQTNDTADSTAESSPSFTTMFKEAIANLFAPLSLKDDEIADQDDDKKEDDITVNTDANNNAQDDTETSTDEVTTNNVTQPAVS